MNQRPWAERAGQSTAAISIKWRWLVMLSCIAVSVAISYGASSLKFAPDYRVFFGPENPDFIANEKAQDTFGKSDNIAFLVLPENGDVFDESTLSAVHALTNASWRLPYVSRVDSITNFQSTTGIGDDLIVEDLVFSIDDLTKARIDEVKTISQNEPLIDGFVVSRDGQATLVNAIIQVPTDTPNVSSEIAVSAREIRDSIIDAHPNVDIHISGVVMLSAAFEEAGLRDSTTLIPAVYLFIILVILIALRSISAAITSVMVIALSTLVAMGVGGFTGVLLTPISLSAPTIVLTIAVADAIHVMSTVRTKMRIGLAKNEAIVQAVALNFAPIAITSITTIVGFLSLNFSDSPPFHHLGNITAAGIAAAWVFSITFLPAMLSALPVRYKVDDENSRSLSLAERIAEFVIAKPKRVFMPLAFTALGLITMIPKMEVNDQWSGYFDDRLAFKQALDASEPYFGTDTIEFIIDSGSPGQVTDPAFLKLVASFTDWLRMRREDVVHAYSVSDVMKRINKNLNSDNSEFFTLPSDKKLAGQYLLVYELSLPYGLDLNDRIDIDRRSTRVTATTKDISTERTKAFIADAKTWFDQNTITVNDERVKLEVTGSKTLFAYVAQRNIQAMFESAAYLIVAILIIISLAFRSFKMGLLSLLPNTIPILATFGAWALLVGTVGFSVAAVGAVAVGLVVDFTVHFMAKYLRARKTENKGPEDAIRYAFSTAGNAIFVTTIVLAAGFAVLVTSTFKLNADLGLLTAISVIFAMIANLLLLPAGLLLANRTGKKSPHYHFKETI